MTRLASLRSDRGSTNIEMAILFPVFIVLILLAVQTANVFHARTVALAAAQQGAAAASAYGAPAGVGEARAAAHLTRMGDVLTDWDITVTTVADATGVRVTVTGTALGWLGMRFRVSQTAYSPIERFTTENSP